MKKICTILAALLIISCVFLTACGGTKDDVTTTDTTGNGTTSAPDTDDETVNTDDGTVKPVATIEMEDGGIIKIELYPSIAPNTVYNFISLANSGFYDGLTFHRGSVNYFIQGGDPNGDGSGGPGYNIKGEFSANGFKNNLKHERGIISMARRNTPYDSAGCQFFIVAKNAPNWDGQYAAFGKVTEGMDVVDGISKLKISAEYFVEPPVIKSIRVDTFGVDYPKPETIK